MKAMKWLTFVSAAALFVAGCSDDADKPAAAGKTASAPRTVVFKSPLNPAIKPEAAIAVVNGTAITRADYDRWIALRTRVYCLANGIDPYKADKKVAKYNSTNANLAFIDIVRRELIRQECEKKGITASESDIKIMQKRFMKGIKKQNEPFDAYCASLPQSEGDEIRRQVMADALGETYLTKWATNDIHHVSAQEVSNRLEYVENYQKSVDKMNEEAKKRAAEAKAEILAGASFYSVTTNRAEIFKDEGKEWDVFELDEFEPEDDMFKFLATAKTGDISDPLDLDDGIGIVGVLDRSPGEPPDDTTPAPDQYTLVRCMFNAYEPLDEPEDFEGMRKFLLDQKVSDAREAMMKELFASAQIQMPFGRRLFAQAKKGGAKNVGKKKPKKPRRTPPPAPTAAK